MDAQTGKLAQPLVDGATTRRAPGLQGLLQPGSPTTGLHGGRPDPGHAQRGPGRTSSPPARPTASSTTPSAVTPTTAPGHPCARSTTTRPSTAPTPTGTAPPPTTARRHGRRRRRARVGPRLHRVHPRPDLPVAAGRAQRVVLGHLGRDGRPDQHREDEDEGDIPPSVRTVCSSKPAAPSCMVINCPAAIARPAQRNRRVRPARHGRRAHGQRRPGHGPGRRCRPVHHDACTASPTPAASPASSPRRPRHLWLRDQGRRTPRTPERSPSSSATPGTGARARWRATHDPVADDHAGRTARRSRPPRRAGQRDIAAVDTARRPTPTAG